jgi:hypothetical protein
MVGFGEVDDLLTVDRQVIGVSSPPTDPNALQHTDLCGSTLVLPRA